MIGIFNSPGSFNLIFSIISFNPFFLKRSILFKIKIIFFPSLINELISLISFLLISPATTNKIRSE